MMDRSRRGGSSQSGVDAAVQRYTADNYGPSSFAQYVGNELGGEFDDLVLWIPVGLLYGRMIAAGVLP